ncbi:MAG: hypothetical protein DRN92_06725 [Thermoproteota archaeon]|nr:MAG: hypothetical protein DRN92_06725 [Candidatus Korarchaeota archaeon]
MFLSGGKIRMRDEDIRKILATSGLLLVDAMVFHEVLARSYDEIRTLSSIRSKPNIKKELEDSWKKNTQKEL